MPFAIGPAMADAPPASYERGRQAFIADMVDRHGFSPQTLDTLLAGARYQQAIVDAMDRPYEGRPWREYRRLFLTPERIQGGIRFRRANADLLQQAQTTYGVPAEIITAIIGVETNYGRNLGRHRVLDALTTLGFSYPRRAEFFRGELEQLLLLSRDEGLDLTDALGSYAGALGKPQFIPSSYRNYAVDFDGDGRRDLWQSDADVIGSVGSYLARHDWQPGAPIAVPARLRDMPPAGITMVDKRPLAPQTTLARLAEAGVQPLAIDAGAGTDTGNDADAGAAFAPDRRATLIELDGDGPEYWLGFDNFYAITRYNHSNLYAMAVLQLSRAIAQAGGE
ncbi:lytic murein transglycosylase B [Thiohalocapsa marina]|uniref:Lytic murein transglycosylase B n=2 Tax=Thiohalocapsa marina TaxID=424902 RepID=A0A5M8FUJ5_9GAMM|nr:lytic murein transglycosylase B [Thiohalocapsa marina]